MQNNLLKKSQIFQFIIFSLFSAYSLFLLFLNNFMFKYILYFIFFFCLSVINFLFIFYSNKLKAIYEYYLIAIISSFFTLYCIEGYLIFKKYNLDPKIRNQKLAKSEGKNFDTRNKYEVYKDHKLKQIDAVPSLHPSTWTKQNGFNYQNENLFPLSGISKKITIYCNENGYFVKYLSDRYGFNNDDNLWDEGNKNIVLGDSFGHGACVHNEFNIPSILSKKLNEHFINLGIGGNGPLIELATLIEFVDLIKPKIIIWLYFEKNDIFDDLENEISSNILQRYLKEDFSQNLMKKQIKIDNQLKKFIPEVEKSYLIKTKKNNFHKILNFIKLSQTRNTILNLVLNKNEIFKKEISQEKKAIFFEIISKAQIISDNYNSEFFVIYVPSVARYLNKYSKIEHGQIFQRKDVVEEFNKRKIKLIDLHSFIIKNFENPLDLYPFGYWGHFNEKGYTYISNYIVDEIKKFYENK